MGCTDIQGHVFQAVFLRNAVGNINVDIQDLTGLRHCQNRYPLICRIEGIDCQPATEIL